MAGSPGEHVKVQSVYLLYCEGDKPSHDMAQYWHDLLDAWQNFKVYLCPMKKWDLSQDELDELLPDIYDAKVATIAYFGETLGWSSTHPRLEAVHGKESYDLTALQMRCTETLITHWIVDSRYCWKALYAALDAEDKPSKVPFQLIFWEPALGARRFMHTMVQFVLHKLKDDPSLFLGIEIPGDFDAAKLEKKTEAESKTKAKAKADKVAEEQEQEQEPESMGKGKGKGSEKAPSRKLQSIKKKVLTQASKVSNYFDKVSKPGEKTQSVKDNEAGLEEEDAGPSSSSLKRKKAPSPASIKPKRRR